ncbi:LOW QUALITY PROTEIN: hypothetical protein CVT26_001549, partial [Gymnopilus dilepis]
RWGRGERAASVGGVELRSTPPACAWVQGRWRRGGGGNRIRHRLAIASEGGRMAASSQNTCENKAKNELKQKEGVLARYFASTPSDVPTLLSERGCFTLNSLLRGEEGERNGRRRPWRGRLPAKKYAHQIALRGRARWWRQGQACGLHARLLMLSLHKRSASSSGEQADTVPPAPLMRTHEQAGHGAAISTTQIHTSDLRWQERWVARPVALVVGVCRRVGGPTSGSLFHGRAMRVRWWARWGGRRSPARYCLAREVDEGGSVYHDALGSE